MKNTTKKLISIIASASVAMAAMPAIAAPSVLLSGKGKDVAVSIKDAGTQFYAAQLEITVGENTYELTTAGDDLGVMRSLDGTPIPLTLYIDSLDLREAAGEMKLGDIKSGADIDFTGISDKAQVILVDRSFKPVELADVDVIVPQRLDLFASLGWDGENFTIDFTYGETKGESIRVYAEDDETGVYTQADLDEGMTGASFATVNTNRQYQAKGVSGGVESLNATAPVSVYSLVMEAIAGLEENTRISANQLVKVNEVLKNGKIFIDKDGNLTKEAQLVMTKTDNVLKLTDKAVTAGLAFTDGTGAEDQSGKYNMLTLNGDGTATLSNGAEVSVVEVLSLDAVNLEFVPTEIAESEVNDSDLDMDFTPEL